MPACRTCGGTGRIYSMRSWFSWDGYSSSKCGYCGGAGHSYVRTDAAYERFQAQARAAVLREQRAAAQGRE
jgi:DnaJ-class molecular chaperone